MGVDLKNSGLKTKIKAINSSVLSKSLLEELNTKRDIKSIIDFLEKTKEYNYLFKSNFSINPLQSDLSNNIWISLYYNLSRLNKFSNPNQKKFISIYINKYKIELIKSKYRSLSSKESYSNFISNLKKLNIKIFDDIIPILEATDLDSLTFLLKKSSYKKILSNIDNNSLDSSFKFDMFFDIYYLSSTYKILPKLLKKKELHLLLLEYGTLIDITNLDIIYRIKKYYNLNNSTLYSFIIPIHYKLKKEDIISLVESTSLDLFVDKISHTYYNNKIAFNNTENFYEGSQNLLSNLFNNYTNKDSYVLLLKDYIHKKEKEIFDILKIINIKQAYLRLNQNTF